MGLSLMCFLSNTICLLCLLNQNVLEGNLTGERMKRWFSTELNWTWKCFSWVNVTGCQPGTARPAHSVTGVCTVCVTH